MALKYRGVDYTTDHRDGSVYASNLTYRGVKHPSIRPLTGSCRRVQLEESYRGTKHTVTKTVCS